jgi:hypothetical protein
MLFELPKPDYGFQPGEVVGVTSAYNLPNLKQNLLLFDKFLLVHKRGDSMRPRERQVNSPDFEWLINQGIAVQQPEPIFGENSNIESYPDRVVVTFGSDEFRFLPDKPVVNLLEKLDSIADVVNSILCRLESQTLNDSEEIEAVPIIPSLTYHRIEGTIPTKKADVRSIVFRSLPVPDEITSLEQILDFRSDPSTRQQLLRLRKWIRETTKRNPSTLEVIHELEVLLGEYRRHMNHHRIKARRGIFEVLLTTTAEIAENVVKLKWGKLAKFPFELSTKKLELFDAEMNAPGREIAYIQHARETFIR